MDRPHALEALFVAPDSRPTASRIRRTERADQESWDSLPRRPRMLTMMF
jgi:hypothetical protein